MSDYLDFFGNEIWLCDEVIVMPLNVKGMVVSRDTDEHDGGPVAREQSCKVNYPLDFGGNSIRVRPDELIVVDSHD